MSSRSLNVTAAQWSSETSIPRQDLTQADSNTFGENVFTIAEMKQRLPKSVFKKLMATIERGEALDLTVADALANAMREWAMERGCTHYTHWFQPLTGSTAEKHDSFFGPVGDGTAIAEFSGKELIQGEPDASSFPVSSIRSTFEARGYTCYDILSPAFIMESANGSHLCIPSAFVSWSGESLDQKIPLLRSMSALSDSAVKALHLLGDEDVQRVYTTVGPEQEYFLIDEQYYFERPDLINTGRTLFGAKPPKGHELDDHYFGSIPERVLSCMMEAELVLSKLGVPIKTRHNEVAPAQYEIAPIFESSNVGADHQQLTMQVLQNVARKYGLVCLLHEKPFGGVNGSGKHNNWSMGSDTGENLLNPGSTPQSNLQFLFFCTAVIQAVDKHQGLIRAAAASSGNDKRLGAAEAPPAIISVFLGSELERVFSAIQSGKTARSKPQSFLGLGVETLPPLPLDTGDRNRTSPFAFTGNKFEFRMLGSNQSVSFINTVLNTVVAEAIDDLSAKLAKNLKTKKKLEAALMPVLKASLKEHGRVLFSGNGYSEEWHKEAEKRGLKNLPSTPDALPEIVAASTVKAFSKYKVLNKVELEARCDVATEQYVTHINIEGETAAGIARTMILPAATRHLAELRMAEVDELVVETEELVNDLVKAIKGLEKANANHPESGTTLAHAKYMRDKVIPAMEEVRYVADQLEGIVADDLWPLPRYQEMLFIK